MARILNLPREETHIGLLDINQCEEGIEEVRAFRGLKVEGFR